MKISNNDQIIFNTNDENIYYISCLPLIQFAYNVLKEHTNFCQRIKDKWNNMIKILPLENNIFIASFDTKVQDSITYQPISLTNLSIIRETDDKYTYICVTTNGAVLWIYSILKDKVTETISVKPIRSEFSTKSLISILIQLVTLSPDTNIITTDKVSELFLMFCDDGFYENLSETTPIPTNLKNIILGE